MAITRAQQFRQMLKNGKRVGLFKGAQADASAGKGAMSPGTSTSGGSRDVGGSDFGQFERRIKHNQELQGKGFLGKDLGMNIGQQGGLAKFGDFIKGGGIIGNIFSGLFSGGTGTTKPPTIFTGGGGDGLKMQNIPIWAQLGFNSEAEYLASLAAKQNTETEDEDDFEFYRRFRAEGGRAEYKQGSPKVDPRMKNTLAQNVAANNAQAAANAIQQAVNVSTLTSPSSQMMTPPSVPLPGTGGFTVNTPTGPATFSSPGNFGPQGIEIDGKIYYSEQEAIKDLGIERYNQLMADGGRAGFAEGGMPYEGGIMDLESARQMYGLGKLVKKVTRSVKKIAKSPIGKAALIGAAGFGIPGTSIGGLFGRASFGGFAPGMFGFGGIGNAAIAAKAKLFGGALPPSQGLGQSKGLLDMIGGKAGAAILGTSLVAGMLTPKQEEEAQQISDETGIDINEIRNNPDKYLARRFKAGGGLMRLGYADGTIPSFREYLKKEGLNLDELDANTFSIMQRAYDRDYPDRPNKLAEGGKPEPVAKKTMPLLDMDGQEMDFRAEGGFVPIGRMEKADDVPARLSKNEFVFTADAVRNAGDGDVDKGAEVMYNMMKNLESGGDVSEESQGLEGARKMFQTSQRLEEVL